MRLYLNAKEVPVVKLALNDRIATAAFFEKEGEETILRNLLDRIDLCEKLQDNERKGGRKE